MSGVHNPFDRTRAAKRLGLIQALEVMNKQQQEHFDRRSKLSVYWYNKASDLFGGAAALWASMHAADASARAEKLGLGVPSRYDFGRMIRPI